MKSTRFADAGGFVGFEYQQTCRDGRRVEEVRREPDHGFQAVRSIRHCRMDFSAPPRNRTPWGMTTPTRPVWAHRGRPCAAPTPGPPYSRAARRRTPGRKGHPPKYQRPSSSARTAGWPRPRRTCGADRFRKRGSRRVSPRTMRKSSGRGGTGSSGRWRLWSGSPPARTGAACGVSPPASRTSLMVSTSIPPDPQAGSYTDSPGWGSRIATSSGRRRAG